MKLVVVESPTKAKTIGKFLGKEYEIKASMGHIMDLPKSKLGVDVEHDFTPLFEVVADKAKIIAELKSAAKGAQSIILATDPDREGEAIASHVKDVLSSNSKLKTQNSKFTRVVFHEITEDAIRDAFEHGRSINENLVDAQTARRVLDRLVGYKLSPLLWQKVRRGLSAGRVQSIALRLIVEREVEIEKFKKSEYFTIAATLTKKMPVVFDLLEIDGKKIELQSSFQLYDGEYSVSKTSITTEAQAKEIIESLSHKQFTIADVAQKETRRSPQAPYTTSTLQQDASRRLGYAGKRTMSLAQKLYEEGYITYHRTDSVVLADSAIKAMRAFAQKEYGDKYIPSAPRTYTTKQKLAQEAHEAIRPTAVGQIQNSKVKIQSELGNDHWKLYDMIWKRAVASQMSDAITESTTVLADAHGSSVIASGTKQSQTSGIAASQAPRNDNVYTFKANGSVLVFDGFLKANPAGLQDNRLPEFVVGEKIVADSIADEPHETPAPPRYNDASLIKTLEEKGIGRPSTYAAIIGTIIDRRYVEKLEGRFAPTAIGIAVNEFLVDHFADIDDIPFTAQMEDDLDEIAHGRKKWIPIMQAFYTPFAKKLESVKGAERVKIEVEESDEKCEKCGKAMVVRTGRFGKFLSCSTFPECDFKKSFVLETGVMCPTDNGKILQRKTHKGRIFFSCENYPNCKYAVWKLEDVGKPQVDRSKSTGKTKDSKITKTALGVKKIVRRKKK